MFSRTAKYPKVYYQIDLKNIKTGFRKKILFPPIRATEIVACVCKYVDGISQNLQSVSPY